MDIFTSAKRSQVMSRIRSSDTKPEVFVRKLLFAQGFRFRLRRKDLPGKPDVVISKYRTAVFVNGCFWHCHEGCPKASRPKSRMEFWEAKLRRNQERDAQNRNALLASGWRVLVVWECACRKSLATALAREMRSFLLDGTKRYAEIGRSQLEAYSETAEG